MSLRPRSMCRPIHFTSIKAVGVAPIGTLPRRMAVAPGAQRNGAQEPGSNVDSPTK